MIDNILKGKQFSIVISLMFALSLVDGQLLFAQSEFKTIREALAASQQSINDEERMTIYQKMDKLPLTDAEDVKAVYKEMKRVHSKAEYKQGSNPFKWMTEHLAAKLAKSTSPDFHGTIRDLLEEENDSLPKHYVGPWAAKTDAEGYIENVRWLRLQALITAAGEGKNESALPVLRRLFRKGGVAATDAAIAIGSIGKAEDLRYFINTLKSNPAARINLDPFGVQAFDAIIQEIKSSGLTPQERANLIGSIPKITDRQNLPKYLELLKSGDDHLVSASIHRIAPVLQSEDENLIRDLLKHSDSEVRGQALGSLIRMMDSPNMINIAIDVLKNDRDYFRRASAANVLSRAEISVPEVEQVLRQAAQNDKVPYVREAARSALDWLNRTK